MKNYRYLVPVFLVFLTVASIYMLISTKAETKQEYEKALENARNYTKYESKKKAIEAYEAALDIEDAIDLWLEIGEMYQKLGNVNEVEAWGEQMIDAYPYEPKAYAFLMQIYIESESYASFYQVRDEMKARGVSSDTIQKLEREIEWKYYLQGRFTEVREFYSGYAVVFDDESWGYIGENGRYTLSPRYKKAGAVSEEIAPVVKENGQACFIEMDGENYFVLNENAVESGMVNNETLTVKNQNGKTAYYNFKGEKLTEEFEDATPIVNGYGAVKQGGVWRIIDTEFQEISSKRFINIRTDGTGILFWNDRAFAEQENGFHMIDKKAEYVTDKVFEDAIPFYSNTYAAVQVNGKWRFINTDGEFVNENTYENARSFSNGFAAVCMNGRWGFINEQFEMVIEPQFNQVMDFTASGTVLVNTEKDWECLLLYKQNYK